MTELQWYYEGTTTRIMGLANDFFRRKGAIFRKRKDIPAYEVNQRKHEGSDEPGVNEAALISFPGEEGARQAYVRIVAQGSGCQVTIEEIKDGWDFVKPYWLEFIEELQNQNEIIAPNIAYLEVDEQLLSELKQAKGDQNQPRVNFVIDTIPGYFCSWLKETTASEVWRKGIKFPTERGEFQLGQATIQPNPDKHTNRTLITMPGYELTETDEGRIIMRGGWNGIECIRFSLLPVSENRTEVTAECRVPLVMPYYQQLLEQIAQVYSKTANSDKLVTQESPKVEFAERNVGKVLLPQLEQVFNVGEMDVILTSLSVDYESIPRRNGGKNLYFLEVIKYFQRRGKLSQLLTECDHERPNVDWSNYIEDDAE